MADKPKIRTAPGNAAKRKEKRQRVAKALFSVMAAVDAPKNAPSTYEEYPQDERKEFEKIVDGVIELWDALQS